MRRALWRWLPALAFVALLWPKIDAGTLWYHDELLTASRAREMIVRGDPGTLTLNFAPDFRKPPLQYWLCSLTLRALPTRPELAVRLPSLLGGAACLLALAWLARAAYPNDGPHTVRYAVLALAGCGYFVAVARLGLLDTGAALWLTFAVAGCQRARADPRWWWFTGLVCVIGAWQKVPYAFAAWVVVLVIRAIRTTAPSNFTPANARRHRMHLAGAVLAALLLASTWWLSQVARHGSGTVWASIWRQVRAMTYAHHPEDAGFHPYLYWFWLARDWALPGLCAPIAVAVALWPWRSSRESTDLSLTERARNNPVNEASLEIGWICALYLLALICTPFRAERYLIVIVPLLALLSVRCLWALPGWLPLPAGWRSDMVRHWVLIGAVATTLPVAVFHYGKRTPEWTDLRAAARALGRGLPSGEAVVVATDADPNFYTPGFVAFYGDLRGPWREILPAETGKVPPPCRGLCHQRQRAELLQASPTARQIAVSGEWIVWER